MIAGVLLAAGRSTRFGRQKLLEPWDGAPLVRRSAATLVAAGLAPVIAVIQADDRVRGALQGLGLTLVVNPEPQSGVSGSIRRGIGALPPSTEAVLIAVADQPLLTGEAVSALIAAFRPGSIVAPRYGAVTGNPRVYDRAFFPELMGLTGDRGGQVVATDHPEAVIEVPLPEVMGQDVDRPQDWPNRD
jgi:molybdenum cofactor cytidylyltransferase